MLSLQRACLITTGIATAQLARGFYNRAVRFWLLVQAEVDHQRSGLPR